MVLHTHEHGEIIRWLRDRGIRAEEFGGVLIVRRLDRLLNVVGANYKISRSDRELLRTARAAFDARTSHLHGGTSISGVELLSSVEGVLTRVCDGLAEVRVQAQPCHGLGMVDRGDLVLLGELELEPDSMRSAIQAAVERP